MMGDGWKTSKCSETNIVSLVDECLLQSLTIIQWRSAEGHDPFVERGLAISICDFLQGLLFHWGIQLHHLTPNSILHLSIFVHLCEAFLGIELYFDLFCYLFHLKPQLSANNIAEVGGAGVKLRQGMEKKVHPIQTAKQSSRLEG